MDLQKTILCSFFLNMLLFLASSFRFCGATRDNLRGVSGSFQGLSSYHKRVRRYDRKCTNDTTFTTALLSSCYYDRKCFTIFSDCCFDYEARCGRQDSSESKSASTWKCVDWKVHPVCFISGVTGVWMIYKCPEDWPSSELIARCENAPSKFSYPVEDFIPVVGSNNLTYRNKHCALCHGMESYTSWNIDVKTLVLPPKGFDLNSRLRFIENNGGTISVFPGEKQPRRYCFGRNYIDNCNSTDHPAYKDCIDGPVQVVSKTAEKYFKNTACAECNGYPGLVSSVSKGACGKGISEGFSVVFNLRSTDVEPSTSVVKINCPVGTVYDTSLMFCREGYIISRSGKLSTEFLMMLWFKLSRVSVEMNSTLEDNLKSALVSQFSLLANQISNIVFHKQESSNHLTVATFRLTLTPFQSLIMANQHQPNINITNENIAFLNILNSTGNFTIAWRESSFFVVKLISKRLSCYEEKTFQPNEYKLDMESGKLVENKTGKIFLLDDYTLVGEGGNMTICRKLVLSDCTNGTAYVPLRPDEFVIFPNLSVYQNATGSIFNFGEYLIDETLSKGNSHKSNETEDFLSPKNSKISVCLPFNDTFIKTITKQGKATTSYGLRLLTLIGFSISMTCLILLVITYGLFKELRTLPGMNLMSLSFSMLLSHFFWLISAHFNGTTVCKGFAILGHYLHLVSFLAMSVISFHSCRAFSQPLAIRGASKPCKKFLKYSVFVWLPPALYVAVCVTLDEAEAFIVDYGRNCWLGTANAKLYLFLLPIAIILLYNIYTFIKTGVSLARHEKQRKTLQRQEGNQNVLICIKLATLVGFPWLFSFFGVLFPDVRAFEYLFVIFVCLQGLYIGMAFLFNKKTLKLYKDRLNIDSNESSSYRSAQTFEMTLRNESIELSSASNKGISK